MLKPSQFNYMTRVPDTGYWVLLNFATGSIARLNAFQKELVFNVQAADTRHIFWPLGLGLTE